MVLFTFILNFLSLCFHLSLTLVLGTMHFFTSNWILGTENNFYTLIEKCSMEYLNSSLCKLAPFVKSQHFVRLLILTMTRILGRKEPQRNNKLLNSHSTSLSLFQFFKWEKNTSYDIFKFIHVRIWRFNLGTFSDGCAVW